MSAWLLNGCRTRALSALLLAGPLACGGADNTSNMQWQTIAASKAKDKIERKGCGSR
jgi:hypothetical protein